MLVPARIVVAVGTGLTASPPHRSGRAELPHPVLTLDNVPIVAHNSGSLAAPRVVGQQYDQTVNNYPRSSTTPGAAMDTVGTEGSVRGSVRQDAHIHKESSSSSHDFGRVIDRFMNRLLTSGCHHEFRLLSFMKPAHVEVPARAPFRAGDMAEPGSNQHHR